MANPVVGQVVGGYGFLGGDPNDKTRWLKVGETTNGYQYVGGDPNKPESWSAIDGAPAATQQAVAQPAATAGPQLPPVPPVPDQGFGATSMPFWRRLGYETLGGSLGAMAGAPLGPLGAAGGMALGTMGGTYLDRLLSPKLGGAVEPMPAGEVAREAALGGMLAPMGGRVAEMAGAGLRGVLRPPNIPAQQRLSEFARTNVPPLLPAVTESTFQGGLYNMATPMPGGARATERYTEAAADAIRATARAAGGEPIGSKFAAGEAIQKGAEKSISKFYEKSGEYLSKYRSLLPENMQVDPTPYAESMLTSRTLLQPATARAHKSADILRRYDAFVKDYGIQDEAGQVIGFKPISFNAADELRQAIGKEIGRLKGSAVADKSYVDGLRSGYEGITSAMEDSISRNSDVPAEALKAWNLQKEYFRRGITKVEAIQDEILNKTPEQIYGKLESGNYSEARKILGRVPAEYRAIARGEIVDRLGHVPPGSQDAASSVWDPVRFVTNLSKLADAKDAAGKSRVLKLMFGRDVNARRTLEDLGQVASYLKKVRAITQGSPTAANITYARLLEGMGGIGALFFSLVDPSVGLSFAGGAYGVPKVLTSLYTNPQFIRAMAYGTKIGTPGFTPGQFIARLGVLSGNQSLTEEQRGYVRKALSSINGVDGGYKD